jgi:hypothetical protein
MPKASGEPAAFRSCTVWFRPPSSRAVTQTRAPSSANNKALSYPMPFVPPLMQTVAFFNPNSIPVFSCM